MDSRPRERVALVTGAGRGIGAAVARALAADGFHLALLDVELSGGVREVADEAEELGVGAEVVECDVRDAEGTAEAVRSAVADFGGLHAVVCNAGITRDAVSWKMADAEWDEVLAVNLKGAFNVVRAAVPALRDAGWGRIVAVSSINGLRGKFGQTNYSASKAGLIGLMKSLAREVGAFGITVNVVAPGMVATEMTKELPESVVEAARAEGVLGRLVSPAEVASAVAFLCSERAGAITGETLRVDGGQYI